MEQENQSQPQESPKKSAIPMVVTGIVILLLIVAGVVLSQKSDNNQTAGQQNTPAGETIEQVPGEEVKTMDEHSMMSGSAGSSGQAGTSSPAMENPTGVTTVPAGSKKIFTVTGENFKFSPDQITVKKGDTVQIVFKNMGGFHDFVIDEFKVKTKQIQEGASETVEFVVDKVGSYEFYCSVGKHREMGMKGTLVVQ